jgi:hypothetical protein
MNIKKISAKRKLFFLTFYFFVALSYCQTINLDASTKSIIDLNTNLKKDSNKPLTVIINDNKNDWFIKLTYSDLINEKIIVTKSSKIDDIYTWELGNTTNTLDINFLKGVGSIALNGICLTFYINKITYF